MCISRGNCICSVISRLFFAWFASVISKKIGFGAVAPGRCGVSGFAAGASLYTSFANPHQLEV
jgi:hypothetical protein